MLLLGLNYVIVSNYYVLVAVVGVSICVHASQVIDECMEETYTLDDDETAYSFIGLFIVSLNYYYASHVHPFVNSFCWSRCGNEINFIYLVVHSYNC